MSLAAKQEFLRRQVEQGVLDFSEHASVSNAVAPGVLIRTHTVNCEVRVTDVVIYNADAGAAVITLYDEDSNVRLVVSVGAGETAVLTFKASIIYGEHNIWGRTSAATNAEVTVAGREIPPTWA